MTTRHMTVTVAPGDTLVIEVVNTGEPPDAEPVAEMLEHLVRYGSPGIQEAYDGLAKMGLEPSVAEIRKPGSRERARYLRWLMPGQPGKPAILYLYPMTAAFTRPADQDKLSAEFPELRRDSGQVVFPLETSQDVQRVLCAAELVTGLSRK